VYRFSGSRIRSSATFFEFRFVRLRFVTISSSFLYFSFSFFILSSYHLKFHSIDSSVIHSATVTSCNSSFSSHLFPSHDLFNPIRSFLVSPHHGKWVINTFTFTIHALFRFQTSKNSLQTHFVPYHLIIYTETAQSAPIPLQCIISFDIRSKITFLFVDQR
jgi:hypothetical protein